MLRDVHGSVRWLFTDRRRSLRGGARDVCPDVRVEVSNCLRKRRPGRRVRNRQRDATEADMQQYDEKAWRQIEDRRRRMEARRVRTVVPERIREIGKEVAVRGKEGLERLPGSEQLQQVIEGAMHGAVSTIGTGAAASVSQRKVLRRYERNGHAPARIEAIQVLDLEVSDAVFPRRRRFAFMSGSAAQGGLAGAFSLMTAAGTVVGGVAGAGAGAVPGALALAGVLALDAGATLGTAARVVAETAAHYGYDPNDPGEELFMASVLGVATAGSQCAKITAHQELNHVAGLLARRATKATLSETNLARVLSKIWPRLVERLTHQQMGKATPALGIVLGASLNANLMKRVSDEAYYAYRERRLRDRYDDHGASISDPLGEAVDGTLVLDLLEDNDHGDGRAEDAS
jgi:hypothetical protein